MLVLANYASKNSDELAYAVEQAGNNASQSLQNTVDNIVAHAQNKPKENEADGAQTGEGAKAGASGGSASPDPDKDPDDKKRRHRGLPPEGEKPPHSSEFKEGSPSRPSEDARGGRSLWDESGGEWRYHDEDKWHNPHWDYNPHDAPSSSWEQVPIGDLPPVKPVP